MPYYFETPQDFEGKTLESITNPRGMGSGDNIARILGISANEPLRAGQNFSVTPLPGMDWQGAGEYQSIRNLFTPSVSPQEKQAQSAQNQLNTSRDQAVSTLQSGQQTLKDRYKSVIDSIKGRETNALQQSDIASAREFAKRGISTQSGAYDQFVQGQRLPISTAFAEQEANAGLGEAGAQNNILSAIANLQSQTGFKAADIAMALAQLSQNQQQFDASLAQGDRSLTQNLEIARMQNQPQQSNPYDRFTTLGEGQTIYDLNTLQSLFTNPKTYKGTSGGGRGDSLGLR